MVPAVGFLIAKCALILPVVLKLFLFTSHVSWLVNMVLVFVMMLLMLMMPVITVIMMVIVVRDILHMMVIMVCVLTLMPGKMPVILF
jgi:hypothetical protein